MGVAADTYANLVRSQWDDYKNTYLPVNKDLLASLGYNNFAVYTDEVADAQRRTALAFDVGEATQARNLSRLGMVPSAGVLEEQQKLTGLSRGLALVDTSNRTRMAISDRDRALMVGGLPNSGKAIGLRSSVEQGG